MLRRKGISKVLLVYLEQRTTYSMTTTTALSSTTRIRTFSSKQRQTLIQPKPPGEKDFQSKFPLPDKDKELELAKIQNQVQDYHKAGDYTKALKASKELLKVTEDHFGLHHPATASTYSNVGLMHKQLGDFDDSRKHYQTALKIYKQVVGTDHHSYASILHNLGVLNKSQIHFDASLKATDRLSLVEDALLFLQQAYEIRRDELGEQHPHTVSSRSSWGSTIAMQILHHYKVSNNPNKSRHYIAMLPENVTTQAWDVAQEHLEAALQTAIDHPRGPSIVKKKTGRTSTTTTTDPPPGIVTLSAAAAAQNLAIVLKARATAIQEGREWQRAVDLYRKALHVRTQLLPAGHPDIYATQYSLAEVLEQMGDEEGANRLRQEIVDTYDPALEPSDDTNDETTVKR